MTIPVDVKTSFDRPEVLNALVKRLGRLEGRVRRAGPMSLRR